jgi:long-chain acyl-CoA synthetase
MAEYLDFNHGERPLAEYVRIHTEKNPDKTAVIFYGKEMSWRELEDWSNRLANAFADMGYKKGDRIAVYLQSCPQCYVIYLAAFKLGLISVPIDPMHREFELEYALNDSGSTLMVAMDQLYPVVKNVKEKTRVKDVIITSFHDFMPKGPTYRLHPMMLAEKQTFPDTREYLDLLKRYPATRPDVEVTLTDDAWILYTGGTSGYPKGCLHTHFTTLLGGAGVTHLQFDATSDDIMITPVPHTHMYGLAMGITATFYMGWTIIIMARWDATAGLEAIHKYRPTKLAWPMPCTTSILDHPDRDKYDLRSFTACNVAAFVIPYTVEIASKWREITGCQLDNYGYSIGTETFQYCATGYQVPFNDPVAVGIGRISPGVQIRIVDFETRKEVPMGERGEIVIKSPGLLKYYINKPEVNKRDYVDGWLYSGDIGTIKEDGYIYFYGRYRDVIKVSGYTFAPRELEIIGMTNPAIDKIAVLGLPHPKKMEEPKAFITLKPGYKLTAEEVTQWFKDRVAAYKVPAVEIRESLPISNKGEVLKRVLKDEELAKMGKK